MTATLTGPKAGPRTSFYQRMALICLAVAVIGFIPTFFLPVVQGAFPRPPMTYMHGLLMFGWTIYFCIQTGLVAKGQVTAHREWGLLGVGLATAIGFSVMTIAAVRLHENPPRPPGLVMLDVSSVAYFEVCVAAALASIRRPEVHKRFMLLATITTMNAPIGRLYGTLLGPQVFTLTPSAPLGPTTLLILQGPVLIASTLIIAAMVFDWRERRRVSLVYALGLPLYVAMTPVLSVAASTTAWLGAVHWLRGFGG